MSVNVMLVDDSAAVRLLARRALSEAGFAVVEASDGVEAMEILQRSAPPIDLVLTDLIMPRLNGIALGERLSKVSPDTPVLYMSGYIEALLTEDRIPEHSLLRKPFTPDRLVTAIANLLPSECT